MSCFAFLEVSVAATVAGLSLSFNLSAKDFFVVSTFVFEAARIESSFAFLISAGVNFISLAANFAIESAFAVAFSTLSALTNSGFKSAFTLLFASGQY